MKKLLGILVLGLLVCNSAYALGYKVKLKEKNKYGTVFRISLPLVNDKAGKWDKAFQETIDISNENCKTHGKKSFTFWSKNTGWYSRDENGMLYPKHIAKDKRGIIQDMETNFKVKVRYFCGKNIDEAHEIFKNYDQYFGEKFKSKIKYKNILYSETSNSPFSY